MAPRTAQASTACAASFRPAPKHKVVCQNLKHDFNSRNNIWNHHVHQYIWNHHVPQYIWNNYVQFSSEVNLLHKPGNVGCVCGLRMWIAHVGCVCGVRMWVAYATCRCPKLAHLVLVGALVYRKVDVVENLPVRVLAYTRCHTLLHQFPQHSQ